MVLVHGRLAHHLWWQGVETQLAARFRVALLDLTGHGDSGHRLNYNGLCWVDDVLAVAEAVGPGAVIAGHSMGGRVALVAAARRSDLLSGVVMLDTAIRRSGPSVSFPWYPDRTPLVRPTQAELVGRFRLRPSQPHPHAEELAALAEYAIRRHEQGWTWKYDQRGVPGVPDPAVRQALASVQVPVRFVRAGESRVVTREMFD